MVTKKPPITPAEKSLMQRLRSKGLSFRQIAAETGRTYNGVRSALDPKAREAARAATAARRARAKAEDPDGYYARERAQLRAFHSRRPELKMLYSARESAKRQGIPFDLEEVDIQIPDICPVLGIKLQRGSGERTYASPSLDRLIPELGYVKGNVCVISWRANKLKGEGSADEHFKIAQWMTANGAA